MGNYTRGFAAFNEGGMKQCLVFLRIKQNIRVVSALLVFCASLVVRFSFSNTAWVTW